MRVVQIAVDCFFDNHESYVSSDDEGCVVRSTVRQGCATALLWVLGVQHGLRIESVCFASCRVACVPITVRTLAYLKPVQYYRSVYDPAMAHNVAVRHAVACAPS